MSSVLHWAVDDTPKKPRSAAIREQGKALVDHRDELERKAGVHQLVESERNSPFFDLFRDLPTRERKEAERSEAEHVRSRIRDIYFSIIDSDLRCKLIAVDRKLYLNRLERKEIEESWGGAPSMPPDFTVDEELSGERDGRFDRTVLTRPPIRE
jgi:hypothetical protein